MRLSWNEIRARAARFADEWKDAHYEKGETQSFYNDFFQVFGVKRRKVASFEEPVKLLGERRGFIDLFWKGVLLVEQKSAGRSLKKAKQQALDYFPGLRDAELPRYVLASDFQNFELYDLEEDRRKPTRPFSRLCGLTFWNASLRIRRRSSSKSSSICSSQWATAAPTGTRRLSSVDPAMEASTA